MKRIDPSTVTRLYPPRAEYTLAWLNGTPLTDHRGVTYLITDHKYTVMSGMIAVQLTMKVLGDEK